MPNWLKREHAEAKRDGAKPQKNSGRGIQKGDALLTGLTVDYKMSDKSFTITREVWAKICSDAAKNNLSSPAIKAVLGTDPYTRLWIIDESLFKEMREAWFEKYEVQE
jgi:hypothetical protein